MENFYATKEWQKLRAGALERDSHTCQGCGSVDKTLLVHHKLERKMGGKDELNNLISLCKSCHVKAHYDLQKSRGTGKYNPTDEELEEMGIGW